MSAIENVLSRLERVRKTGASWYARCPAHDDRSPSLRIALGEDDRVLLDCKVGCRTEDVIAAIGLEWRDLFEGSSSPTSVFVPKRASRDESSPPLSRQQIEDDWDDGLLSAEEYLSALEAWNLGANSPRQSRVEISFDDSGEVSSYRLRSSPPPDPEFVLRDDADYFGPGDEPRKLRPPLTRDDFGSLAEYRAYEDWRQKAGSLPPKAAA